MIVDCAVYEDGRRRAGELPIVNAHEASCRDNAFVWIGLWEPTEEEFDSVRREFDLHELAVEDAVKAHQRPKLEFYGDSLFIVLKPARYVESEKSVEFGEILIFIGDGFIITVRHGEAALHDVRLRIEERPDLLRCGPGAPRCTRSSTGSSTTISRSSSRSTGTSGRSSARSSRRHGTTPPRPSTT